MKEELPKLYKEFKEEMKKTIGNAVVSENWYDFDHFMIWLEAQNPTEQYRCQSYVEGGELKDCTCGKCF